MSIDPARRGLVLIVSAPSGGGKGTILAAAMQRDPNLLYATSATTRPPRDGEIDGEHYTFLDESEFRGWIRDGRFTEWAEVHGWLYGTPREQLEKLLKSGKDVVLEVDVQGMRSIKRAYPGAVSIFISPPSLEVLETRLRERGGVDENELATRLANARREISAQKEYDHVIINDDVERAVAELAAIVENARNRAKNLQKG